MSLLVGIFCGFLYTLFVLPKNKGGEPKINPTIYPILYKGMIIIPYNNKKALHLHHWIFCFIICMCSYIIYIPNFIKGFSITLLIQGITYKDSLNIVCKNPYIF